MVPFMKEYEGKRWLMYSDGEPSEEAKAFIPEMLKLRAMYPMKPGTDMEYLDDTLPEDVTREDYETKAGQKLVLLSSSRIPKEEKRLVFYVHGGGYVRGNGKYAICNGLLHLQELELPTACCEYRLMPEYREGAAMEDVISAWEYLIDTLGYEPENIIVTGDSAGGQLALSLALWLKREGRRLPAGLAVYSPGTDMRGCAQSYDYNAGKDIIFPDPAAMRGLAKMYVDEARREHPDASPLFGDFTGGFPRTYFCAEDTELLCMDSVACAERMDSQGVEVLCHVYHGLWHAWPALHPVPPLPKEVHEVFREVKGFLKLSK